MPPHDEELTSAMRVMKQEILDAVAGVAGSVAFLRTDVERIDVTTRETERKVQYLCDNLLGDVDRAELKRVGGKR